jgi:hypothetical protein
MREWAPSERSRHGGVDELPVPGLPGRLLLCGKHFVGPDVDEAIAAVGATTVVCLCESSELAGRYDDYVAWLLAGGDGRGLHRPVPDFHVAAADELHPLLDELEERLAAGATVLLHCGAGIGRTGTVAAALLVRRGAALEDALAAVRAARPMAGPEVGAQRALLEELERARGRP